MSATPASFHRFTDPGLRGFAATGPALFEAPDPDLAEFQANLRAIRAHRAAGRSPSNAQTFNAARLAAAYRANARIIAMPIPTVRAPNSGPCPHCGARGTSGCNHFLPHQKEARHG